MKRNYIAELKEAGLSLRTIEAETGISHQRLSEFFTGRKSLSSTSKAYEALRNANRRVGYQKLRREGMVRLADNRTRPFTGAEARKYRRAFTSPEVHHAQSTKKVSHMRIEKHVFQLKMLAEYEHDKTHERKIIESFSKAHSVKPDTWLIDEDYVSVLGEVDVQEYDETQEMLYEAIRDARGTLGDKDYNWQLVRIIHLEVITYHIGT